MRLDWAHLEIEPPLIWEAARTPSTWFLAAGACIWADLMGGDLTQTMLYSLLAVVLALLVVTDYKHLILPDTLTFSGLLLGLILAPYYLEISYLNSLAGALVGGLSLYFISLIFMKIRGIYGLGFGDAKLLALLGAWVGVQGLLPIVLLASLSAVAVISFRRYVLEIPKNTPFPFGPFLIYAGWLVLLYPQEFWQAIYVINQIIRA